MEKFISEDEVEAALDWLRDNASAIGRAKEEAFRTEHMLKHVKALAMKFHLGMPVSAQLREAEASSQYLAAIESAAIAAGNLTKMYSLREAAALKIESWRSASANYRSMKI